MLNIYILDLQDSNSLHCYRHNTSEFSINASAMVHMDLSFAFIATMRALHSCLVLCIYNNKCDVIIDHFPFQTEAPLTSYLYALCSDLTLHHNLKGAYHKHQIFLFHFSMVIIICCSCIRKH